MIIDCTQNLYICNDMNNKNLLQKNLTVFTQKLI